MKARWIVLVAMTILSARLAGGQTGSIQPAGIDPALLAKATKGDVAAQVTVGESYASGTGVTQDYKMAAEGYRKAADKGDIAGELHLAASAHRSRTRLALHLQAVPSRLAAA